MVLSWWSVVNVHPFAGGWRGLPIVAVTCGDLQGGKFATFILWVNPEDRGSKFFFFQLYNSLWVLACSIISSHCFLSCVLCFQLVTPIFLKSFLTSSSHLTLGLPFGLVAYSFHFFYVVLATLSLVILSTCPNQLSRLYFMYLTIFSLLIAFSSSSFVVSLHSPFAFCVGPNFLLNIFLSNRGSKFLCKISKCLLPHGYGS